MKETTKVYAWRHVAQGCICISNSLDKMDIYMKFKTHGHENLSKMGIQVKMHESSKLDYTSTLMGTNRHSSTNIYKDLFVAHYMYKYKS